MILVLLLGEAASAKSWCAAPIVAHEWGVTVLRETGVPALPANLPSWFARSGVAPIAAPRVRDLPADSGERTLPVVQFHPADARPAPVAVEVGFTQGHATAWFPPVDRLSLAEPDRQLVWESLVLTSTPTGTAHRAEQPWVEALRSAPSAAWVNRGAESERFLFYEGRTREVSAVTVSWPAPGVASVHNRSDWVVHDVAVVAAGRLGRVEAVSPGATVEVALDRPVDAAWRADARSRWIEAAPARPRDGEPCVTMRDPAVPTERATGHALYAAEVDVLLSVWGERLFSAEPHVVYREDVAALDAVMPVALYTDMLHFFDWRRLGLVLVEPESAP